MSPPSDPQSLRSVIDQLVADTLATHEGRIDVEIDVDSAIGCPCSADALTQLIGGTLRQALAEMDDGELSIIAWAGPSALELKIADSGGPLSERAVTTSLLAARMGTDVIRQDCPQGGVAVTFCFPRRAALREVA